MPKTDPITQNQYGFLSKLYDGAIQQGKQNILPDALLTQTPEQWHLGIQQSQQRQPTREEASELIDHLIFQTQAVPVDKAVKPASEAQINYYYEAAARTDDLSWRQVDVRGMTTWTLSALSRKLDEHLTSEKARQQHQFTQPQVPGQAAALPQTQGQPQMPVLDTSSMNFQ